MINHTNIQNASSDITVGDVKRGFQIAEKREIGFHSIKQHAERIADEIRASGGDSITIKPTDEQ